MVKNGDKKYYVGIGIKKLFNKELNVISFVEMMGTNRDVPVYKCEDENGNCYKVLETSLSDTPVKEYKYAYGGMGDCFPKHLERFPSFKNGKYIFTESIWD